MFRSFFLLIISFLIISLVESEYNCKKEDKDREIEIGDIVTLCIHSREKDTKVAYKLKVDEYSIITILGGYGNLTQNIKNNNVNSQPNQNNVEENNSRYRRMKYESIGEGNNKEIPKQVDDAGANIEESSTPLITNSITNNPGVSDITNITKSSTPLITNSITNNPGVSDITNITDIVEPSDEDLYDPADKSRFLVQIGGIMTKYPSLYYRETNETKKVFTVFSLVVKVKQGKITDIVWDNACYDCTDKCEKNIKSISEDKNTKKTMEYENCYEDQMKNCNNGKCDPKFYITWFGTDKNGNQLKSSNLALSKFKKYSIASLYDSVKNIFN